VTSTRVSTRRYSFEIVRELEAFYLVGGDGGLPPRRRPPSPSTSSGRRSARCLLAIFLDGRHRVTGYTEIARGTLNASRFTPRDLLVPALKVGCGALVLAQSSVSVCRPLDGGPAVTRVVLGATELVGLPLLDPLIVIDSSHYSFREAEGWEE
jgi:hypothetical protein